MKFTKERLPANPRPPATTTRPPHPSAFLPSTTLFRSCRRPCPAQSEVAQGREPGQRGILLQKHHLYPRLDRPPPLVGLEDRKSTRLNSSHVEISYAVFCLKKKKKDVAEHALRTVVPLG